MNRAQLIYALAYYMAPGAYQAILTYPDSILRILLANYESQYKEV